LAQQPLSISVWQTGDMKFFPKLDMAVVNYFYLVNGNFITLMVIDT
jgi:hypothetical protein